MNRSRLVNISREHLLRALFPPAVTLLFLLVFSNVIDGLQRMNPFPEGEAVHSLYENSVGWLVLIPVALAAIWPLCRWPDFLRLPSSVSLIAAAIRLVCHGFVLFVVVTVGTVVISYLFYDTATDPQGQFHIWVWVSGFLYAAALAPMTTLFTVWRGLRNAGRTG